MEVEKNYVEDKDSDSESGDDSNEVKFKTEFVEMNSLNKESDLLIIGSYGNASGYLKVALYDEFKINSGSLKGKFFQVNNKDKSKPKKLVGELYQITYQGSNTLILIAKEDLNFNNYQTISDMLLNPNSKQNIVKSSKVICLDSKHYNDFVKEGDKTSLKDKTYFIQNKTLSKKNENFGNITEIPVFNGVTGFSAYLLNKCDILNIPCVYFLASTSEYKVCLDNLKTFNSLEFYPIFKGRLDNEYLKSKKIDVTLLLKEFNHYQTSIFT